MRNRISGERVEKSSFFRKARARAAEYLQNSKKLDRLLDRARRKSDNLRASVSQVQESLQASLRLLRAYANGSYREIPWDSLISIAAAVIYFVMPLDMIPDFILSLGLVDDIALLGWILSSVRGDIDRFLEWEKGDAPDSDEDPESQDENSPSG